MRFFKEFGSNAVPVVLSEMEESMAARARFHTTMEKKYSWETQEGYTHVYFPRLTDMVNFAQLSPEKQQAVKEYAGLLAGKTVGRFSYPGESPGCDSDYIHRHWG